jgi:hypothetical protein
VPALKKNSELVIVPKTGLELLVADSKIGLPVCEIEGQSQQIGLEQHAVVGW